MSIRLVVSFVLAFVATPAVALDEVRQLPVTIGTINMVVPFGPGVSLILPDDRKIRATGAEDPPNKSATELRAEIQKTRLPLKLQKLIINLRTLCSKKWPYCLSDGMYPTPIDVLTIGPPPSAVARSSPNYSPVRLEKTNLQQFNGQTFEFEQFMPCAHELNVCTYILLVDNKALISLTGTGPTNTIEDYHRLRERAHTYFDLFIRDASKR